MDVQLRVLIGRVLELRFRDSKKFVSISRTNVRLLCTHILVSGDVTNSSVFKKKKVGRERGEVTKKI